MFGRSSNEIAPALPVDGPAVGGGRSAAISILPGMPLPHDLVQAPIVAAPADAGDLDDARAHELVSVGAQSSDGAQNGDGGFGLGTLTPPPPMPLAQPEEKAKAKRSSFSGLRRRKDAPDVLTGTDDVVAPIEPATGFFAPVDDDGEPVRQVGEAHILTEVHQVASAPEPFDITAELAAEATEALQAPHAVAAPETDFGTLAAVAPEPQLPAPPPYVASAPVPVAAPVAQSEPPVAPAVASAPVSAAIVDEDPLFHHVPVHTGAPAAIDASVEALTASPEAPAPAAPSAKRSFVDRLRGARGVTPAAVDAAAETMAPPPYVPAPAEAIAPPPYVPAAESLPVAGFGAPTADAPPAYVPLGSPAATPVASVAPVAPPTAPPAGPPIEAVAAAPTSANVPNFAHLVPTQPVGFPADMDAMAAQVAAQVAADHASAEDAAQSQTPQGPTIGLVFADGSHAELADGPDGAALQHVARVLASDGTLPRDESTAPIE